MKTSKEHLEKGSATKQANNASRSHGFPKTPQVLVRSQILPMAARIIDINNFQGIRITALLAVFLISAAMMSNTVFSQVYPVSYLDQALQNNPGLEARQKAYDAALQEMDLAPALPDPELSVGIFTPPMERLMGNQWFDVRIMQMFPWFGTRGRQREAAGEMAEESRHMFRAGRNSLFMEMTRLWLEIYKIEQQQVINEQFIEILGARENIIYSRYAAGQPGLALDIYRLEIQIARLENEIENLDEEKKARVKSFNILAGREETAAVETPSSLPEIQAASADIPLREDMLAANPRLNMAQARAGAAGIQEEISHLRTRPMLGAGLQYSWFAPGEAAMGQMEGGHMLMPMFSVSLPVFTRKNRAAREQGSLLAGMAALRVSEEVNALKVQFARLEATLNNLERDRAFYRQQLEITGRAWELVLTAYSAGREGFDELLSLQDQLLELEVRLLENGVDRHISYAEMDMLLARNIFK